MRGRIKAIAVWLIGAGGALIGLASQTSVVDATSNLSGWLRLFGVGGLPSVVLGLPLDQAALAVAIFAIVGAVAWSVWPVALLGKKVPPSIPIAFKEIRGQGFSNYPYTGGPTESDQPQLFDFGVVTIANCSQVQSVSLELHLHLTADGGWDMKLPASPLDILGRDIQTQSVVFKIKERHGVKEPPFLQNPILITPGVAVTGRLIFLFTPFDAEMRNKVVGKILSSEFNEHLMISDIFSDVELRLELPAAYRGDSRST